MSLKSSYEILNDLLSRGVFSIIYVEQNFPLPFQKKGINVPLNSVEAESVIISSAVAGASGIGFSILLFPQEQMLSFEALLFLCLLNYPSIRVYQLFLQRYQSYL